MEELNCKAVRLNLWDYAAGVLGESGNDAGMDTRMDAHLHTCRECDRCLADVSSLRKGFRHLPVQAMPPLVATRLQVIASRERSRQLLRLNPAAWLADKVSGFMMAFNHFLKPYAVPAAGGVVASCLCFGLIAQTLQLRPYVMDNDMPVGLFTEMTIDDVSPFSFPGKDVTVELTVDANGAVTDFTPIQQAGSNPTPEELNQIAGLVLYSTFTPATRFGQRVSSKRLFAIRHFDYLAHGTPARD
jgi:hypothetical protein